jgi:hypothetical protein
MENPNYNGRLFLFGALTTFKGRILSHSVQSPINLLGMMSKFQGNERPDVAEDKEVVWLVQGH